MDLREERNSSDVVTKRFYKQGIVTGSTIPAAASSKFYYNRDHLGSIREMTDSTAAVRARYDYDPYGRRTKLSGDLDCDLGYTGHYFHAPSTLHLTYYRAYDANFARWLSRDPIAEHGGINLYGYVANSPTRFWDPFGLCCQKKEEKQAQEIKLQIAQESAQMLSEGLVCRGSTVPGDTPGSSCKDVSGRLHGALRGYSCWDCKTELRSKFPWGGRDHQVVVCTSKRKSSKQMMFDFWNGDISGSDPTDFRDQYPYPKNEN